MNNHHEAPSKTKETKGKEGNDESVIDSKTLLQVNATAIVGVLFFLTLSSFLTNLREEWAKLLIGTMTLFILVPFAFSACLILGKTGFSIATSSTSFGFAFLAVYLFAAIFYPYLPIPGSESISRVSIQDECEMNPNLFNVTHSNCSKFGAGGRAEECATNPQRYGMKISECSIFSGPRNNTVLWPKV
jgi:hypothetical protein